MHKLLPVYIAIVANAIILIFYSSKRRKPWSALNRREKNAVLLFIALGLLIFILVLALV